jgi:hypothetical protein
MREICQQTGFDAAAMFIRAVENACGVTPPAVPEDSDAS